MSRHGADVNNELVGATGGAASSKMARSDSIDKLDRVSAERPQAEIRGKPDVLGGELKENSRVHRNTIL